MEYEFVDREIVHGDINGSLYGSSVALIARSPTHLLFHGLGSRIAKRDDTGFTGMICLTSARPTKAVYEDQRNRDKIDSIFGTNAATVVFEAIKQKKTVLFDGGGKALIPCRKLIREKIASEYEKTNINFDADLTGQIKTCRQCGANLKPVTTRHIFDYNHPNHPTTLDECQRLSNHKVVMIRDFGAGSPNRVGKIKYFETWDGVSLVNSYFCSDACASTYGYRAAQELPPLEINGKPSPPEKFSNSIIVYENPNRKDTMTVGDKIFKI